MNWFWLKSIVVIVQILAALGIIVLVLLQKGKGAEMGAAFGSGSAGSLFGARGSANFLSRTTAILATIFFVCTLGLAVLSSQPSKSGAGVLGQVQSVAPVAVKEQPGKSPAPTAPVNGVANAPVTPVVPK